MYHARQTFEINCHKFVNSMNSLIFDSTEVLLPRRLVLIYRLTAKVMHCQMLFIELKSSY